MSRTNRYDDWLPTLIVRAEPSRDTVFRAAYSRSIGRPEYAQLSLGGSLNTVDEAASSSYPDLRPCRADNVDVIGE